MQAMDNTLQDLVERIRTAAASGTALRIRGGGTLDFYGQAFAGEVLDTRAYAGVTSYEPSELVVTARAGTSLAELEALLEQQGQCLPFEPPHFAADMGAGATVGGMVAAGLSGPARASVGSVRDYVLGISMINGRGDALTFGGQVMKNVAGYDVSRLLAGSLGILGLITDLSLKVLPVAPAQATLRFEKNQAAALQALNEWGGLPLPLNASAWSDGAGGGSLMVRLRGAVAAVRAACSKMGGERLDDAAALHGWQALRHHTHPFFSQPVAGGLCLWRLSVAQSAPALDLPEQQLVEWHGGLRWLWAPAADAPRIRAAARQAGGHATLFRCSSEADRQAGVFEPLATPLNRIHRELKQQFDPAGIFNPGRLYADL
ncbi:MAG: glycolate oxidase subunit GlcE [Bdellovibrionales bacterium]|nr:glycolate oxidase subunit GlcE [Ramlibacter sp.]